MTIGLRAARRLAFTIAALVFVTASPITSSAIADSSSAFASLGHAWLTVDSNLRSPSRLSAWAIDDYLSRTTPLPALGHAFKTAESRYNVNALYLLAHAMHETAFGTSYIGQRYHNLFGWNAADRNPSGLATRFPTYAQGVDYVASQISEHYLSPYGKFFGGAATLRGMHYYASDPMWGALIARIANGIVLSTLSRRGVIFAQPVVGEASTGQTTTVSVAASTGDLPDGLQAAYRFVPVAIVEAGSPTGSVPAADPAFRLGTGATANGSLRLTVDVPKRAGRYRLEVQLRDTDGTALTEYDVPEIADTAVRVFGSDAVAYDLGQDGHGLTVIVTNEGRRDIAPGAPDGGSNATVVIASAAPTATALAATAPATAIVPAAVETALTTWLIARDGMPILLATSPLDRTLRPGDAWTAHVPLPDSASLPGILVVRLQIAGAPGRLGGSPPGVFRVSAIGTATASAATASPVPTATADPAPTASATASADPAATASADTAAPGPTPSPDPSAAGTTSPQNDNPLANPSDPASPSDVGAATTPAAGSVTLAIGPLTPADAATRMFLDPVWKPAGSAAAGGSSLTNPNVAAGPSGSTKTSIAASKAVVATSRTPVVRLSYLAIVNPKNPGGATIRITNTGGATLTAHAMTAGPALATNPSATPAGTTGETTVDTAAIVLVTAVPAWGPAAEPVVLTIPLLTDIAPGRSVDVHFALPASAAGQSTYLVVARVVAGGGQAPNPATVFWLRGAATRAATGGNAADTTPAPIPTLAPIPTPTITPTPTSASTPTPTPTNASASPKPSGPGAAVPAAPTSPSATPVPIRTHAPTPTPTLGPAPSPTAESSRFGTAVLVPNSNR